MIGQLITKLFTGEASIFLARLRTVVLLYALMAIFALGMLAFLLGALFVWFAQHYGVLQTAIGFAIVCLVFVLALYVVLVLARRPPKQRAGDRMQRDIASIAGIAAVSNIPLILTSVRRRKGLLLFPVAALSLWGILRTLRGYRGRI